MPTGYTEGIEKLSFNQFVWKCARAFGAFIMQREDSLNSKPVLEESLDGYYTTALQEAKDALAVFDSKSEKQRLKDAEQEIRKEIKATEKALAEKENLLKCYERKLAEAKAWIPPSDDHQGLKEFMISQITDSIRHDCDLSYYRNSLEKLETESFKCRVDEIHKRLVSNIKYYAEQSREEHDRVTSRNRWKRQLLDSVPLE